MTADFFWSVIQACKQMVFYILPTFCAKIRLIFVNYQPTFTPAGVSDVYFDTISISAKLNHSNNLLKDLVFCIEMFLCSLSLITHKISHLGKTELEVIFHRRQQITFIQSLIHAP